MRSLVLSYRDFINEAYLDQSGRLRDFDFSASDRRSAEIVDRANQVRELLEDFGANRVSLTRQNDEDFLLKFKYGGQLYYMEFSIHPEGPAKIYAMSGSPARRVVIYQDTSQSLMDLITYSGLDFLAS